MSAYIWHHAMHDGAPPADRYPDVADWSRLMCGSAGPNEDEFYGYFCTMNEDHDGPHVAYGVDELLSVWSADDPATRPSGSDGNGTES